MSAVTKPACYQQLQEALQKKTAKVGVVGLGYVGLPLSVEFASAGIHVVGIDIDQEKVDAIGNAVFQFAKAFMRERASGRRADSQQQNPAS